MSLFSSVANVFRNIETNILRPASNAVHSVAGNLGNFFMPGEPFETGRAPQLTGNTGNYRRTFDLPDDPNRVDLLRLAPAENTGDIKLFADNGVRVHAMDFSAGDLETIVQDSEEPSATIALKKPQMFSDGGGRMLLANKVLNPRYVEESLVPSALGGGSLPENLERGSANFKNWLPQVVDYRRNENLPVTDNMLNPWAHQVPVGDYPVGLEMSLSGQLFGLTAPLTEQSGALPGGIELKRGFVEKGTEPALNAMGYTKSMNGNDIRSANEWIIMHEYFGHGLTSGAADGMTSSESDKAFTTRLSAELGFDGASGENIPYPLMKGHIAEFGPAASAVQQQYMRNSKGTNRLGSPEQTSKFLRAYDTKKYDTPAKIWADPNLLPEFKRVLVYRLDKKRYGVRGSSGNTFRTGKDIIDAGLSFLTPAMLASNTLPGFGGYNSSDFMT